MAWFKKLSGRLGDFFRTIVRSCYDMAWYRQVRQGSVARAFGYFAALNALIVFLALAGLTPAAFIGLRGTKDFIAAKVPAGSTLTLKAGALDTNLPQPFALGSDAFPVVMDTTAAGLTPPAAFTAPVGAFIGRDAVFFRGSADNLQTIILKDLPDFSLDKEKLATWLDRSGIGVILAALALFAAFFYLASIVSGAVLVLLLSLFAWLVGRLWRLRLAYRQWLAVGFYALTLPILVRGLFGGVAGLSSPPVFVLLFFMIVIAVIMDERARPVATPDNAPRPAV